MRTKKIPMWKRISNMRSIESSYEHKKDIEKFIKEMRENEKLGCVKTGLCTVAMRKL